MFDVCALFLINYLAVAQYINGTAIVFSASFHYPMQPLASVHAFV